MAVPQDGELVLVTEQPAHMKGESMELRRGHNASPIEQHDGHHADGAKDTRVFFFVFVVEP